MFHLQNHQHKSGNLWALSHCCLGVLGCIWRGSNTWISSLCAHVLTGVVEAEQWPEAGAWPSGTLICCQKACWNNNNYYFKRQFSVLFADLNPMSSTSMPSVGAFGLVWTGFSQNKKNAKQAVCQNVRSLEDGELVWPAASGWALRWLYVKHLLRTRLMGCITALPLLFSNLGWKPAQAWEMEGQSGLMV